MSAELVELVPFTYGETAVRVVMIDGEPWFVLADLCKVLGLGTPARVRERLDEGVSQAHTLPTAGGAQQMTIVSEPGMYEVVIRSDKPEAVKFRRWITGEVLPTLRRTGVYALSEDEIVHQALAITARRVEELQSKVAELTPPASAWNQLAEATGDYSVADAAKVLSRDPNINTGRDRLFAFMAGLRWVYRDKGWRAYQSQVDNGRLVEKVGKPYWHEGRGEYVTPAPTIRITPKGLAALHQKLGGTGQLELMAVV